MKYANGITCLCTVLACGGAVMAQGFGFGNRSAPEIQQEKPSHSLYMEINSPNGLVDDAVVTVMTLTGAFKQAELLQDGTYYVDKGVGTKTIINIDSPSQGIHAVDFQVPATPMMASMQIFISGGAPAKVSFVDRRAVSGRPLVPAGEILSHVGGPAGGIAGVSNCCFPNGGIGCDDPACEATVCAIDPFCCDVAWDGICAGEAADLCGDLCTGGPPGKICDGSETPENEPVCADNYVDATNGGCNSTPPVFSPLTCGQSYCGEAGTFISGLGNTRDTDWYRLVLAGDTEVTWTGTASFPSLFGIVNNFGVDSCAGVNAFLAFATGIPGQTVSVTECLPAGTWYLFAATSGFTGTPCGSEYTVTATCAPCKATGPCEDPNAGDCCVPNGGIGCNNPECCNIICALDPFCCDVEWDGICADEAAAEPACNCGGGGSNCCSPHGTPGCDDPDCEAAVCAIDPFCCDVQWDGICVGEAEDLCGKLCGGGGGVCPPNNNDCCAPAGSPGCNQPACCESVCALDPFCCDVAWDSICAGEALADPNCDCGPGPANDDCINRIDIANGSTPFNNIGASQDGPAPCGAMGSDIWYNYNADFTGELTIDTFGSGYDTVLAAYAGCECPVGAPLACNDDTNGLQSEITIDVVAGNCYKLQVGGFAGSQGSGVINITKEFATGACCFAGGECLQVTGVECENLGGNYLGDGTACAAGYEVSECNNAFSSIVGLPGTILAPTASNSDDAGDVVPIGFNFDFFGTPHATIGIASNGYLTFGATLGDFTNDPIPNAATPNDLIAPYWDDWNPAAGGDVFYRTTGSAPNRTLTVQWNNVPHFSGSGPATFQAILSETSNCVEYRYGTPLVPNSPTIGVENADGSAGFPGGFGPPVGSGDCLVICPAGNPCPTEIEVNVDIKPGVCPNPFHLTTNPLATLAVVIVGKGDFDVSTVDVNSLSIGGVSPLSSNLGDVSSAGGSGNCGCGANGGDGITDLVLNFQRTALQAALGIDAGDVGDSIELTISGALNDATPLTGSDCVVVE